MYTYLIRRFLTSILVLFGVSVLVFSIIHLVPGDAVTAILGRQKGLRRTRDGTARPVGAR
jgi:peptide/nickel transport system permease protein